MVVVEGGEVRERLDAENPHPGAGKHRADEERSLPISASSRREKGTYGRGIESRHRVGAKSWTGPIGNSPDAVGSVRRSTRGPTPLGQYAEPIMYVTSARSRNFESHGERELERPGGKIFALEKSLNYVD